MSSKICRSTFQLKLLLQYGYNNIIGLLSIVYGVAANIFFVMYHSQLLCISLNYFHALVMLIISFSYDKKWG